MSTTRNLSMAPGTTPKELEDAFIKVSFEEIRNATSNSTDPLYDPWIDNGSAQRGAPELYIPERLRKLYPNHSLVSTSTFQGVLGFPGALVKPVDPSELITSTLFVPLARRAGSIPGILIDSVEYGAFHVAWDKYDFVVYVARWSAGLGFRSQEYILHQGPQEPARALILKAGLWSQQLHEEIWVYHQYWRKDHGLWVEVRKGDWKDVILEEERKKAIQKDIYGFFDSEDIYKELFIPWKRGLIVYGPPGNGKTISIKVIMKTCEDKGYLPLYVKSFQSYMGDEAAMTQVFDHARQCAPCVLILEDLDSLITPKNRSFFLNQLDGLEGNDGLLVIGTTNHVERLDPALSARPSRFDRKYLFDDPTRDERVLYCQYWQKKLSKNPALEFPDSLVEEAADLTDKFSFAYLKEAFISTLVLLAVDKDKDTNTTPFPDMLKEQIKVLRKQLDERPKDDFTRSAHPEVSEVTYTTLQDPSSDFSRRQIMEERQRRDPRNLRSMALTAQALGRNLFF